MVIIFRFYSRCHTRQSIRNLHAPVFYNGLFFWNCSLLIPLSAVAPLAFIYLYCFPIYLIYTYIIHIFPVSPLPPHSCSHRLRSVIRRNCSRTPHAHIRMINDIAGNIEQDFISRSVTFSAGEKKQWRAGNSDGGKFVTKRLENSLCEHCLTSSHRGHSYIVGSRNVHFIHRTYIYKLLRRKSVPACNILQSVKLWLISPSSTGAYFWLIILYSSSRIVFRLNGCTRIVRGLQCILAPAY